MNTQVKTVLLSLCLWASGFISAYFIHKPNNVLLEKTQETLGECLYEIEHTRTASLRLGYQVGRSYCDSFSNDSI